MATVASKQPKAVPSTPEAFQRGGLPREGCWAPSAFQRLACCKVRSLYHYTVCKPISSQCRSWVGSMPRFGQPKSAAKPIVREGGSAACEALSPALLELVSAGESSGRQRGKRESGRARPLGLDSGAVSARWMVGPASHRRL